MPAKRKHPDEAGEDFVLKAGESTEVTKAVSVTIHDFIKKIDDLENSKFITCPNFYVAGKKLSINIYLEEGDDHIVVFLFNRNDEKIKASCTFKHESGRYGQDPIFKDQEIEPNEGHGIGEFLSHEDYKKWAEGHGDVFRVEAEITLHLQDGNPEPVWETFPRKRFVLYL